MADELRVEFILNRRVRAVNGRVIGRLEEIRAESTDGACYVTEYLVGAYAFFERFAAWPLARSVLRLFHPSKRAWGYRVRWDQLELTDPARPTLRCKVDELSSIDETT
jgi:hypothetical protein